MSEEKKDDAVSVPVPERRWTLLRIIEIRIHGVRAVPSRPAVGADGSRTSTVVPSTTTNRVKVAPFGRYLHHPLRISIEKEWSCDHSFLNDIILFFRYASAVIACFCIHENFFSFFDEDRCCNHEAIIERNIFRDIAAGRVTFHCGWSFCHGVLDFFR